MSGMPVTGGKLGKNNWMAVSRSQNSIRELWDQPVEEFNRNPFNHPIWPFINSIVNDTFLNKWQFLVKFKMISLDLPVSWRVPLRVFTGIWPYFIGLYFNYQRCTHLRSWNVSGLPRHVLTDVSSLCEMSQAVADIIIDTFEIYRIPTATPVYFRHDHSMKLGEQIHFMSKGDTWEIFHPATYISLSIGDDTFSFMTRHSVHAKPRKPFSYHLGPEVVIQCKTNDSLM